MDQPILRGRGLTTFIRCIGMEGGTVTTFNIYHRIVEGGVEKWTVTAQLEPPGGTAQAQQDAFGGGTQGTYNYVNAYYNYAALKTHIARNIVMIGASRHDGQFPDTGVVYVYSGEWSKWSHHQTLQLETQRENDYFGTSVAINQATLTDAAVTCLGCDPTRTGYLNSSATYIYSSEAPYYKLWSQQQILSPSNPSHIFIGYGLGLHGSTLIISGSKRTDTKLEDFHGIGRQTVVYVYHRPLGSKYWTEQQQLEGSLAGPFSFDLDVEDETIGISNGANGFWADGILKIYYPDTNRYLAKPKSSSSNHLSRDSPYILSDSPKPHPRSPQWSLQQVLHDPNPDGALGVDGGFASYFSFHGNALVVTRPIPETPDIQRGIFIYERPYLGGQWSVQQYFLFPFGFYLDPVTWYGPTIALGDDASTFRTFTTAADWACLVIRLEDAFGDGWHRAELYAEAPDGTIDAYRPFCDTTNPLEFRYCPLDGSDAGLYHFNIINASKSMFPWEIQWKVYEEKTGIWYRGDQRTKMDFHWNSETRDFTHRALIHTIPLNITCINNCRPKPTPKPSPDPHLIPYRQLKGATHIPTYSPAPTLSQTDDSVWQYFKMNGDDWFDSQHQGTNYFISDINGEKLISTGTKCNDILEQKCWQNLKDGDYVLRVTGDLNSHTGLDQKWSFCGRENRGYSEMLVFRIADERCDALESYSVQTYCEKKLTTTATADVVFLVAGITEELNDQDKRDIETAFHYLFPKISANNIKLASITHAHDALLIEILFSIPVSSYGYNVEDLTSISSTYELFINELKEYSDSHRLNEIMSAASGTSILTSIQSVQIFDSHIKVNEIVPLASLIDSNEIEEELITTFEPPIVASPYHEDHSTTHKLKSLERLLGKVIVYATAGSGYLIMAALVLVVLMFVHSRAQTAIQSQFMTPSIDEKASGRSPTQEGNEETPSPSMWTRINSMRMKTEVEIVNFLDDIGDGVVDILYPPDDVYEED